MPKVYRLSDFPECESGKSIVRNILRKTTGELNAVAIDENQYLDERVLPFEVFVQLIEGQLESTVNGKKLLVNPGEYLIIPAHARHSSRANKPSKLLHLIIRSGYETVV